MRSLELASKFNFGDEEIRKILYNKDQFTDDDHEHFWDILVQQAFMTSHNDYDVLFFEDDKHLAGTEINPANIAVVEHYYNDCMKLQLIWNTLNADYTAALIRFTISGKHESGFFNFCNGKLDVYYLRKHLERRPNLKDDTVLAATDLPKKCSISSDEEPLPEIKTENGGGLASGTNSKRKRSSSEGESFASNMSAELAKQKLHFMKKEDARQEHKTLFEEWEKVQSNIRIMRQDVRDAAIDESTRLEIQEDIDGLVKRKNELAFKLGLK